MIKLPDKARQKLTILQQERDTAQALVTSTLSRISDTGRALDNNPTGEHAADMEFELTRLRAHLGQYQAKFEQLSMLHGNVRRWINDVKPNAVLSDCKPIKLRERAGESTIDAIGRVRGEIGVLAGEQRQAMDAGLPRDEIRAQVAKFVQSQAMRCKPHIMANHRDFSITFGDQSSFTNPAPDHIAFLCWFDPDTAADLLNNEVDRQFPPDEAAFVMTPADRVLRLAEIKASLLRLELTEEQLIERAEEEGQVVPRRPAADPAAVLGILVERAKAVAA
jgi:hypothetical protein